jgi:ABC-2 type transport system permease protein
MKFLRDTWLVFARSMGQSIRNPVWMFVAIFQPVLFLLLFGPLLRQLTQIRGFGGTNAYTVLVPGLVVQLGLYGAAFVGFGIIGELREGIIERMRVSPVSRVALLLGRSLRDVVVIVVQSTLLVVLSIPFGLSVSVAGAAVSILLVGLLGLSLSALSNAMGLILQSEDALAPISNFFLVPVLLLSGILLPWAWRPCGCGTSPTLTRCGTPSTRPGHSSRDTCSPRPWSAGSSSPRRWPPSACGSRPGSSSAARPERHGHRPSSSGCAGSQAGPFRRRAIPDSASRMTLLASSDVMSAWS